MEYVKMDGKLYRVAVVYGSRKRSFQIVEGDNSGTSITQRKIRDIFGTGVSCEMEIAAVPGYEADYDAFFDDISAPVESHMITVPYGQTTLTFEAAVYSGSDTDKGLVGGSRRWDGLAVQFDPMEPQRRRV